MSRMILGIDTSNYKCSVALLSGNVFIFNHSEYLKVKKGDLGLRQSDAFFQHVQILQRLIKTIDADTLNEVSAIGVSDRPRRLENSYMPVFNAGVFFAETLALGLNSKGFEVPVIYFSHQEGHYGSALKGIGLGADEETLFFHVSGGTTEMLLVNQRGTAFDMDIVSSSSDISFGKLIDRIGVGLGCSFPAGIELEKIANSTDISERRLKAILSEVPKLKVSEKFNLSGYQNKFNYLLSVYPKDLVIRALFIKIGEFISQITDFAINKTSCKRVILSGGVMANSIIKDAILHSEIFELNKADIYFAPPENCGDSAIGPAYLAQIFA